MATQAIAAGASALSSIFGSKGASKAAKEQAKALNNAMAQQQQMFAQTRADNMPFLQAGQNAIGDVGDILGLNGTDVQAAAIEALKASPAFTSLYNTGADTVLQNATATG